MLADCRSRLGWLLYKIGRTQRAIALREAISPLSPETHYGLARGYALRSSFPPDIRSDPSAAGARADADRAMATLCRAVAAGYRVLAKLPADLDFTPLRDRADFRLLLLDLPMPAEPAQEDRDVTEFPRRVTRSSRPAAAPAVSSAGPPGLWRGRCEVS